MTKEHESNSNLEDIVEHSLLDGEHKLLPDDYSLLGNSYSPSRTDFESAIYDYEGVDVEVPRHGRSHSNPRSGVRVRYVDPSELPETSTTRRLGEWDPRKRTITIAKDLLEEGNEEIHDSVYLHEEAHSLGIDSEHEANKYAASILGKWRNLDYSFDPYP
jgi:hypothetical protein